MTDLQKLLLGGLVTLAASASGVVLAAYLGLRAGLTKLRQERAFDRRLTWYEEMVRALNDLHNQMLFSRIRINRGEQADERAFDAAKERVYALIPQSQLFAKPDSVQHIYKAIRSMEAAAVHMQSDPRSPQFVAAEKIALEITRVTARRLANEARVHMGEKPLPTQPGGAAIIKLLDGPRTDVPGGMEPPELELPE